MNVYASSLAQHGRNFYSTRAERNSMCLIYFNSRNVSALIAHLKKFDAKVLLQRNLWGTGDIHKLTLYGKHSQLQNHGIMYTNSKEVFNLTGVGEGIIVREHMRKGITCKKNMPTWWVITSCCFCLAISPKLGHWQHKKQWLCNLSELNGITKYLKEWHIFWVK